MAVNKAMLSHFWEKVKENTGSYRATGTRLGFMPMRQSRSPRARPWMSISAVATLVAIGTECWSHRRVTVSYTHLVNAAMNIAIMCHNRKQELMVQFCTAYCGLLSKHTLCATNATGRMVAEATGLPVNLFLSHEHGGIEQIGQRIIYNEIDMVLFFNYPQDTDMDDNVMSVSDTHLRPL